ncbi:peptide/nickel transport system substrate-binding protein [Sedimentibacter acidaminivorans]|uniref:Peptide/nickel transport system substrate-binding protein n=1 Tax=Sedimentibacter acidaminivorans TaxID=913099 RepID=A0ABS4GCW3_9FIRM|nr:ABC transporter substrate-binding protein [Sedimentibacter acidaminivorans]MBP1925245.1 peptide/nickel transport system substrate-binding protein [Sedimentibacter acidaminivorans]
MFKTKRSLLIMLVILAMVLSVVGCSNSNNAQSSSSGETTPGTSDNHIAGPAIDKDTVVIATADETPSLSAAGHNAVAGDYVNKLTYNGLFRLNKDINPVPDLVKEYTVEEDENGEKSIWVMTLHEGVKFHDGSTLTSDDIIASLADAKTHPEVLTYTTSVVKTEKVDDLTFKIYTDGASSSLLYDLSHHSNSIRPKALIDADNDFNANPIGTGPYKFVEWTRGEQIKFTAHEEYFDSDRAPKIKNIVWKIIPEGSSRTIALESGEVDYVIELDSTSLDSLKANPDISVLEVPSLSHNWLTVNNEKVPFDNLNVRKAVCSAINREDVITVALNGAGVATEGQTPEGMLGFSSEDFDNYDVEAAKGYMDAWGGDPSTIELDIICSNDTKRRAGEVIQANLKEIGINANLSTMDLATYLSVTAEGNFTGFIGGYTSSNMVSFLQGVFLSSNINASNKTRTANPELDALINKAAKTVDQEERRKVLEEASILLNKNAYQMPLYQNYMISAHSSGLDNTFISANGDFAVQEWSWK